MTHIISDRCIDKTNAACAVVCPVDCIHRHEGATQDQDVGFSVNPDLCIDYGSCVETCPVGAIFHPDVPREASFSTQDTSSGSCCQASCLCK